MSTDEAKIDESGSVLPFTGGHEAEALVAALEAAP